MSHYFVDDPNLKSEKREINFDLKGVNFKLLTDNGVFSNREIDRGTYIFDKVLIDKDLDGKILDLGCGYGAVGITLQYFNKKIEVTYTDVNPRCVELTKANLRLYDLNGNCFLSDGFENINEVFNYVVFNPPISIGKDRIYDIYRQIQAHLISGGKLYLVIRKDKGALSHMKYLSSLFQNVSIIYKEKGYLVIECL